tara:strand:- start:2476 stop:5379 length:2904 start_codon:yes stop_codon:yes gene_type:complete
MSKPHHFYIALLSLIMLFSFSTFVNPVSESLKIGKKKKKKSSFSVKKISEAAKKKAEEEAAKVKKAAEKEAQEALMTKTVEKRIERYMSTTAYKDSYITDFIEENKSKLTNKHLAMLNSAIQEKLIIYVEGRIERLEKYPTSAGYSPQTLYDKYMSVLTDDQKARLKVVEGRIEEYNLSRRMERDTVAEIYQKASGMGIKEPELGQIVNTGRTAYKNARNLDKTPAVSAKEAITAAESMYQADLKEEQLQELVESKVEVISDGRRVSKSSDIPSEIASLNFGIAPEYTSGKGFTMSDEEMIQGIRELTTHPGRGMGVIMVNGILRSLGRPLPWKTLVTGLKDKKIYSFNRTFLFNYDENKSYSRINDDIIINIGVIGAKSNTSNGMDFPCLVFNLNERIIVTKDMRELMEDSPPSLFFKFQNSNNSNYFDDYNVINGINLITTTINETKSNIGVFINGKKFGDLILSVPTAYMLDSSAFLMPDISKYVIEAQYKNKLSGDFQEKKRKANEYLKTIINDQYAFARQIQFYDKELNPNQILAIYQNREFYIGGPSASKKAHFKDYKNLGDFVLDSDYSQNSLDFSDGLILEQTTQLNINNEKSSVSESLNVNESAYSKEICIKVFKNDGMTSGRKSFSNLYYIGISEDGDLEMYSYLDYNTRIKLYEGVLYHITETFGNNEMKVYVNGELLLNINGQVVTDYQKKHSGKDFIKLIGTPKQSPVRIHYISLKFFDKKLTNKDVNFLVYDRLSGVYDFDINDSDKIKGLFTRAMELLVGDKNMNEDKHQSLKTEFTQEMDRLMNSHEEELESKNEELENAQEMIKNIRNGDTMDKQRRIQEFLRENDKLDVMEFDLQRRIQKKQKETKYYKKIKKILLIILIILSILMLLSGIWKYKRDDIVDIFKKSKNAYVYNTKNAARMSTKPLPPKPAVAPKPVVSVVAPKPVVSSSSISSTTSTSPNVSISVSTTS